MIDFDEIERILEVMREHKLTEFELERDGLRVRLKKDSVSGQLVPTVMAAPAVNEPAGESSAKSQEDEARDADLVKLSIVKSPIVGTFYRSSDPDAPPFVEVGSQVTKGQVLCIVEAMKLMNEIDAEYDGEVVKVFVENGQPVQYGEKLFAIREK